MSVFVMCKVEHLLRKNKTETWNGNIWLDSNVIDNLEPPSYSELALPVEVAWTPVSEKSNLPFLENPVIITTSAADALKRDAQCQDLAQGTACFGFAQNIAIVHCVMLMVSNDQGAARSLDALVRHLWIRRWEINSIFGTNSVSFWSS